jgi:hypothetical protein
MSILRKIWDEVSPSVRWVTESQMQCRYCTKRQMIVHNPEHRSNEGKFPARAAAIRRFHAPPMGAT